MKLFQLSMRNISHTNLNFHCLYSFTFLEATIFEQELLCPVLKTLTYDKMHPFTTISYNIQHRSSAENYSYLYLTWKNLNHFTITIITEG